MFNLFLTQVNKGQAQGTMEPAFNGFMNFNPAMMGPDPSLMGYNPPAPMGGMGYTPPA
jgi:hypothetical protein